MKVSTVGIDKVLLDPANARRHPERNLETIKASLARFGQQVPIVVDKDWVCRKGNGTLLAARASNGTRSRSCRTELAGSEATGFAIADNRSSELAVWDDEALAETLRALRAEGFDLAAVGYLDDEVDALIASLGERAARRRQAPSARRSRAAVRPGGGTGEEMEDGKTGQLWVIPSKAAQGRASHPVRGLDEGARTWRGRAMARRRCAVTSPPYWGLRDYGTATWEGGKAGCDHLAERKSSTERVKTELILMLSAMGPSRSNHGKEPAYRDTCGKCGARRIDAQLGLEPTPEEYTARMVGVFAEVRKRAAGMTGVRS